MLPVKRAIMILLSLMVGLVLVVSWLMASANLEFAEKAMAQLRQRQIADTFYANLDRINAHHRLMAQSTAGLARAGSLMPRLGEELDDSLRRALRDFPDTHGSTLWYANAALPARYAYRQEQRLAATDVPSAEQAQLRAWFQRLRAANAAADSDPSQNWTAAYYKDSISSVVISHATLISNNAGTPIGLAVTDWLADDIIRTISRVEVTPGTFSFLLDHANRNLSSLSAATDQAQAQPLINAVIDLQLGNQLEPQTLPQIVNARQLTAPLQQLQQTLAGDDYRLFFARSQAGMVFGIGVPQAEIDAVLAPMRESNLRIQLIAGVIMLLISGLVLYLVAGTLRQLQNLYTDSLTGLPNRERLLADLKKSHTASLILLNIDSFKEINDFYGHSCGDHVIISLAHALQEKLDTNPDWRGARLYRMPADELAIWLPGHHNAEQLTPALEQLLAFIGELQVRWEDQPLTLNASLGVACSQQGNAADLSGEQLLHGANIALELARLNLESFVFYDASQRVREGYEQNLIGANRLRAALDSGRIVAFYQPILNLATGQIDKYECLVRMLDEQGEPISPIHFLDLAKKIRLYRTLTRRMVDLALERFEGQPWSFSLNLSCEDLLDPELSDHILDSIASRGMGKQVIFEILESEGIENYSAVRQFIDRAKAQGCRIAIDDFGTGYSNFEHLLRLDVDLIKIDGSLIRQLDSNPTALTLCRGIVQFAQELSMQTVAEFVHNPAVLNQVRALGIQHAQGAAIGMPSASLITEIRVPDADKPSASS